MSIAVTMNDASNNGVSTTSNNSLTGGNAADLQSSFLTLLVALKNSTPLWALSPGRLITASLYKPVP